jgi:xylono-1,5-lactonase
VAALRVIGGSTRTILGESPLWDERTGRLHWVDIERGQILSSELDSPECQAIDLGQRVGSIALRGNGRGFIAALEHSVALLTGDPLEVVPLAAPESHALENRSNDGKCDPTGNFWFGTCDGKGTRATGWLYRVDSRGTVTRTIGPFICTNGPAFSPDGRSLYCVDTYGKTIYRCGVTADGHLGTPSVFLSPGNFAGGYPDGITCDAEGGLWVAQWGGACVSRFSSSGELSTVIPLPVTQPTSCAFAGRDLCTLVVTSASLNLAPDLSGLAGAVFAIDLAIAGIAPCRFGG